MAVLACVLLVLGACELPVRAKTEFSGERALEHVRTQLEFGPRVPGTEGHRQAGEWIAAQMRELADTVIEQRWTHVTQEGDSLPMRNILARFNPDARSRILYIAHWDTRPVAEKADDPRDRERPIPGANDGASGVAVLIGVADVLSRQPTSHGVDLLFVDGEDYAEFEGEMPDVLIGSRYFARNLPSPGYRPLYGVVWDMVGAQDAVFHQEGYSMQAAPEVVSRVWQRAADLGYSRYFVRRTGMAVIDDHLPLIEAGLRVIDVIHYPYSEHHKPSDDLDRISVRTLQAVGDVATSLALDP